MGNIVIKKIPYMESLVDPFTKPLLGNSIGVKCVSNLLWLNYGLRLVGDYQYMILVSLLSIIFHTLYFMIILGWHLLHCKWLECIKSCMKDLSHGFFTNKWFVHSRFVYLANPFENVIHYLLVKGMSIGFS